MIRRALVVAVLLIPTAAVICGDNNKESDMSKKTKPGASRPAPPRVRPVCVGGVCYAQAAGDLISDGQVGGILAAYDKSKRELWRLKVYENGRRPDLEGDVQDVWFRSLRADGDKLVIENERGERFEVDPATREVIKHISPGSAAVSDTDPISGRPRIRKKGGKE